jgi:hypothetical protein
MTTVVKRSSLLRVTSVLLIAAMAAILCAASLLADHYVQTKPAQSDPGSGRTYPVNFHGKIVFVSWGEYLLNGLLLPCAALVGVVGGGVWLAADRRAQ